MLVCTTIIESGLDIPNANTIIINQADRLGLAQLYQLRGRVGRGAVRAYAYLLYDRGRALSEAAQQRLQAIFEATELGAGFQIALRDLEIRGAGNLLGAEQSGHMAAVGFDLYVRLLGEAVERLKALQRGETPPPPTSSRPAVTHRPAADGLSAGRLHPGPQPAPRCLPAPCATPRTTPRSRAIEQELVDRFGQLPPAARNLLWVVRAAPHGHRGGHRRGADRGQRHRPAHAARALAGPRRRQAQAARRRHRPRRTRCAWTAT